LHQHGQGLDSQRVKVLDGVTTALEMEIGAPDVQQFLAAKEGRSLIHYGTTASHVSARALAFGTQVPAGGILPVAGTATDNAATAEQMERIRRRLRSELDAGALGIGMGIQYTPGATRREVIDIFRLAAERHLPVFTHVRSAGHREPGSSIEAVSEVIGAAAISGAPLHINSSCGREGLECLGLVEGARAHGIDVTTEAYPYTAGMTYINSALFNPGWREKFGVDYHDLMLPETGERLNKGRFEQLHAAARPQLVILFSNTQEAVDAVVLHPLTMIASDGDRGHPRNAGTYSRVLAQYVRAQGRLTLMDALRKMSLMPAEWLERSTADARAKGRLQEGADADIVAFDPATIQDRATYQSPSEPSVGMKYVLVGGTVVVDNGQIAGGALPGKALIARQRGD
jgi:N-acyl-D-aspartate/D-glutamate deacylase